MSDVEMQQEEQSAAPEAPREPAAPIESRFLFVDVAALRAKQLRRGAKPRVSDPGDSDHPRPTKAGRIAMSEVRSGMVEWDLPDFQVIFDNR